MTAPQTPSIVYLVAAHDAEPWLGAALDSLRAQSRPDWACVVVDDASFDETHAIARAAADTDPRIRAVTIPHAGVAGARDAGLDHAPPGAPFVCFLDADDTVEPDHADALVGALGARPDADAVACGHRLIDARGNDLGVSVLPDPRDGALDRQVECNRVVTGAGVVRRATIDALRAARGFAFDPGVACEDWEFWLAVTHAGARWAPPVVRALLNYRRTDGTRSSDVRAAWRDAHELIDRMAPTRDVARRAHHHASLRAVSRALVRADGALLREVAASMEGLTPDDVGPLVSAIRYACGSERRAAEGVAPALAGVFPETDPALLREIARRSEAPPIDWDRAVGAAGERRPTDEPLVLFGFGSNGRAAYDAATRLGVPVAVADDFAPPGGGAPTIEPGAIGPRHAVLVTPDDRRALLDRLGATGAVVVDPERPEAQPAPAAAPSAA